MARSTHETGTNAPDTDNSNRIFQANGAERIDLPSSGFLADADIAREGDDLVLQAPNGETVTIQGYFSADPAPVLQAPDGAALTPNLVKAFVHSPYEYAANNTASDESPVGAVEEVKGHATVTRADGTVETIANGTPIYQGDVIETDAQGAVNIVFIDETSMAVSANARLAIDEYTYDPSTESGTTNFSVLRGLFVFTSGLIGRDDPDDVKIDTPVGSIGIRGTIIAGEINPGGESNISVLEGAIVVQNSLGEVTLSQQFETVRLSGFDQPMTELGTLPASEINTRFDSIGDVNPSLFTTIGDTVREQSAPSAPEQPKTELAPENSPTSGKTQDTQNPDADIFTPIDSSPPSLNGGVSALPSIGSTTGGQSSGLFGTLPPAPVGSQPNVTGGPVTNIPVTGTNPAEPFIETKPPTSPVEPQLPPPVVTPGVPASPVFSLSATGGTIDDLSAASTIVRTVDTGRVDTVYTIGNNPNNYYELVSSSSSPTGMDIKLTAAGAAALATSLDIVSLGGFTITATNGADSATENYSVTVTDANGAVSYNLDGTVAGVSKIIDNYTGGNGFGYSISALGDIDGDGFDDFIVGKNSTLGGQNHIYEFSGQTARLPSGNVAGIAEVLGLPSIGSSLGNTVVAGIGDFNGDGVEDYIVGQSGADSAIPGSGNVVFVNGANPAQTMRFSGGLTAASETGAAVDGIGDFNNDGYADVVIGMPGSDSIYYVGGNTTSWTGFSGSKVDGASGSEFGRTLTALGDFNGDGYTDYAVGALAQDDGSMTDVGKVFIYGGNADGAPSANLLKTFTGTAAGDALGSGLYALGDINGDGKSDLMITGAGGEKGYVVFGNDSGGTSGTLNMSFDVGGYKITGGGGVGDFNGDGYDDFTVSLSDANGTHSYVVFGKNFTESTFDINFFKDPENALEFKYSGAQDSDRLEVSAIGDINGDGYDDFAMGVPDANGATAGNGGMFVFYGRDTGHTAAGTTATADNQSLVGGVANNSLSDGGFENVSLRGGAGSDLFMISNTNFLGIDGGGNAAGGHDVIKLMGTGTDLDFTDVDFEQISGIEGLKFGANDQTMVLSIENLFNLLKTSDDGTLRINGEGVSGSNLVLTDGSGTDDYTGTGTASQISEFLDENSGGYSQTGTASEGGVNYNTFQIGGYTLMIDNTITVDAQ